MDFVWRLPILPSIMSNSLSIIGALLLGDFAVQSGWFVPETILYAAFTAIANYAQPSLELGFAFKFIRLGLLILTGCFGLWGLCRRNPPVFDSLMQYSHAVGQKLSLPADSL